MPDPRLRSEPERTDRLVRYQPTREAYRRWHFRPAEECAEIAGRMGFTMVHTPRVVNNRIIDCWVWDCYLEHGGRAGFACYRKRRGATYEFALFDPYTSTLHRLPHTYGEFVDAVYARARERGIEMRLVEPRPC